MADVSIIVNAITAGATQALARLNTSLTGMSARIASSSTSMYKLGHTVQEVGQNMSSMGQKATMGISLPLAALGKTLVSTGAGMLAMHNTFKIVFGDLTKEAHAFSANLSKEVGLSSGIIDKTNLQFAKMGGAMGLTGQDTLDFSSKWTQMTLDLAAFTDIPIDEATERMMSGLRGEVNAVEKLGIFMGEANIKTQMFTMGLKGQYSELSDNQKMTVLYALATKQTAQAQGQAKREADSYQNAMSNLKQSFAEFAEVFYLAVQPAVMEYIENLKGMLEKLKALTPEQIRFYATIAKWLIILPPIVMYLGSFIEGMGRLMKVMSFAGKGVVKLISNMQYLPTAIGSVWLNIVAFCGKIVTAFSLMPTAIGLAWLKIVEICVRIGSAFSSMGTVVMGALQAIATFLGISVGWVIAIIVGIAVAVYFVIKYWDEIKAWTIQTWGTIVAYLSGVWTQVADTAVSTWSTVSTFFTTLWTTVSTFFITVWTTISTFLVGVWTGIATTAVATWTAVAGFFSGLWTGIQTVATTIWTAIVGFFTSTWTAIVSLFTTVVTPIVNVATTVFTAVSTTIVAFGAKIGAVFSVIGAVFTYLWMDIVWPLVQYVGGFIIALGELFIWVLGQLITGAIKGLGDIWDWLVNSVFVPIGKAFMAVIKAIGQFFVDLYNNYVVPALKGIATAWKAMCNGFKALYHQYIVPLMQAFKKGWENVKEGFSKVIDGIKSGWQALLNAVASLWRTFGEPFVQLVIAGFNKVKAGVAVAVAWIKSAWQSFVSGLVFIWNSYGVPLMNLVLAGWNKLRSGIALIVAGIKSVWSSFCSGIASLWNSYGAPVLRGIVTVAQGIGTAWSKVWATAKTKFSSFVSGIKQLWAGIKSAFKLPHISIQGKWDLTPPSLSAPKLAVKWNANGGIFDKPTLLGGGQGVGEAGAEAVIPLTNKSKVKPFASTIASLMPDMSGSDNNDSQGVVITGNSFVVREEADINKIAEKLLKLQDRNRRGRGGHPVV